MRPSSMRSPGSGAGSSSPSNRPLGRVLTRSMDRPKTVWTAGIGPRTWWSREGDWGRREDTRGTTTGKCRDDNQMATWKEHKAQRGCPQAWNTARQRSAEDKAWPGHVPHKRMRAGYVQGFARRLAPGWKGRHRVASTHPFLQVSCSIETGKERFASALSAAIAQCTLHARGAR